MAHPHVPADLFRNYSPDGFRREYEGTFKLPPLPRLDDRMIADLLTNVADLERLLRPYLGHMPPQINRELQKIDAQIADLRRHITRQLARRDREESHD